jgi:hypothetical protein
LLVLVITPTGPFRTAIHRPFVLKARWPTPRPCFWFGFVSDKCFACMDHELLVVAGTEVPSMRSLLPQFSHFLVGNCGPFVAEALRYGVCLVVPDITIWATFVACGSFIARVPAMVA